MTVAWLGAAWQRAKKMPKYDEVVRPTKEQIRATRSVNYHKVERLAKEKGLKLPKSFIEEKAQSTD